ncbi:MAG: molybdopterin cofactor-binding domain-containing protein, partial [Gemmatimonadales bacterium]
WEGDRLTVWKTSRAVHASDKPRLARVLGVAPQNVRVVCTAMGGGFGNKDEGRVSYLAALLARKAGRPVRIEYQRDEEFVAGRSRQSSRTRIRIGVKRNGTFTAVDTRTVHGGGACVATGIAVVRRTGQGPLYLYTCPNARYEGHIAYTNTPPCGSYRGLGAPLGHFALESLVDEIADALQIDPLEFRLRHHVRKEGQPGARKTPPGELIPDEPVEGGVPLSSNALRECLEAGAARIGWRERRRTTGSATGPARRGIGVAMCIYRGGHGVESEAEVRITREGRGQLAIGVVDVGQGSQTVLAQMVAEVEERAGEFAGRLESPWITKLRDDNDNRAERMASVMNSDQTPIHPMRLCKEIRDFLDRDAILCVDGNEILHMGRQTLPTYVPGHRLNSGVTGTMGVGLPYGIGAKIAKPDKQVLVLHGDGSMGMNAMELDTCVRFNLPVVTVISNNAGWTARTPDRRKPGRELGFTNFDGMARE